VLTRCGDDLFSITTESPQDAQALASHVRDSGDWLEVIPGIDSVVLQFDASTYDGDDVRQTMESVLAAGIKPLQISSSLVEIPIVYGGEYGPVGFTPGFAFIGGLDERLHVPRRKEPRQRVEAGSVGIADGRTGLYAMASPGGWTLIGRTPYKLFDPHAKPPFVLEAGMRVRFKAISADEFDG
jgi:allophanate hydrolase subunit 1